MILKQSFKNRITSGKIITEISDILKLFTRTYMDDGEIDFWLMDKEKAAKVISDHLPYGMSIQWCEGLERFQVYDDEEPEDEAATSYSIKYGTVEELRELIPADMVAELEKLNDKTIEF